MKLRLLVPLGAGETSASFASRLAAANGLNAAEFCLDWNLSFQAVVDGDREAVAAIARLGGVDAEDLMRRSFVRRPALIYEHRGQRLARAMLRRRRVFICPHCALQDIGSFQDLMPHIAVHGRGTWLIDAVKTCPEHDAALVDVTSDDVSGRYHDFARQTAESIHRLADLARSNVRRPANGLERYVVARVGGNAQSEFLDRLELGPAIRTCEVIGAVSIFGTRVHLNSLSDENVRSALARGFEIAHGGAAGVVAFLDELFASAPDRRRRDGPGAVFGVFHHWLRDNRSDQDFDIVREVVRTHVLRNFPLLADTRLFGELINRQVRHSIRTLSVESGQHPKTLRKRLRAAGVVGEHQMALSDHNVTFDAVRGSLAAREAGELLYLPAARDYLNASRSQADLLLSQGFVRPRISGKEFGAYDQYAKSDLDDFLSKLILDARPVSKSDRAVANIPDAARRACCSAADIVTLILGRKLAWVGSRQGERGYMSVLVNVDEVKEAMRGPDHGGLTIVEVRRCLQANHRVVLALIEHGHLETFTAPNTVNRCLQRLVKKADLDGFFEQFVSLHNLAKERATHHVTLRKQLDEAEISPAFDHKDVFSRFYRRKDLRKLPKA